MKTKMLPVLAVLTVAVLALSMFAVVNIAAQMSSSKTAVAGANHTPMIYTAQSEDWTPVLTANIKTANQKDLVVMFTAEACLLTDTTIKGKGVTEVAAQDLAGIEVKVEVTNYDGDVFPDDVILAKRLQRMEGRLSSWTIDTQYIDVDGDGILDPQPLFVEEPEYVRLILDTTNANGFNFIALDVPSGEHAITVYSKISVDESQLIYDPEANDGAGGWVPDPDGLLKPGTVGAVIGDCTLVVQELRMDNAYNEVNGGN